MKILLDTDLFIDIAANRDVNNLNLDILERELDSSDHDFFITSIGWSKFEAIIFSFADGERAEDAIDIFQSLISIIDVTPRQMQMALTLPVDDFESAIEFICARENDIISILTHQTDNFTELEQSNVRVWNIDFFNRCINSEHTLCQSHTNNISESLNDYQLELLIALSFAEKFYPVEILKQVFCDTSIDSENLLLYELNRLANKQFIDFSTTRRVGLSEHGRCFLSQNIHKTYIEVKSSMQEKIAIAFLELAKKYGGLDYGIYSERYDIIKQEWNNFKIVLEYYYQNQRYDLLKSIWNELNHFTDLYGLHQDRLTWNERIAKIAKDREDWNSYALHLGRQAWIYIVKNKPDTLIEANKLLSIAFEYFDRLNYDVAIYLLQNKFCHRIYIGNYKEAEKVLIQQQEILELNYYQIDEILLNRAIINISRNSARLLYFQGRIEAAKRLFKIVLDKAEKSNWLRYVSYAYNKLADIAIEQGELEEAVQYLEIGYEIAQINNNSRRKAGYAKSYARLEECRGNKPEAQAWNDFATDQLNSVGLTRPTKTLFDRFLPMAMPDSLNSSEQQRLVGRQ